MGIYTLYALGVVFFIYIVWLVLTLSIAESQSSDRILLEVIYKTRRPKFFWVEYKNQKVSLAGKKEYKGEVSEWVIGDSNTMESRYPDMPLIPNFMKRQVRKTLVYEWSAAPVIQMDDASPVIDPRLLGVARMTGIAAAISATTQEMMNAINRIGKILNPSHYYIGTILTILAIGAVFLKVNKLPDFAQVLTKLDIIISLLGGK